MPIDRRTFLKAATASAALGAPRAALAQPASAGGLSTQRLRRMHDVMAGHVARGQVPGVVTLVDDFLAFGRMMLNKGKHRGERILSRLSVEVMTTDQITAEQEAASEFFPGFWNSRGWGFGVSIITRRTDLAAVPGRYGWDGGYGRSWYCDPREDLVGILMTQRVWDSPSGPAVHHDFWTSVYQAIDD